MTWKKVNKELPSEEVLATNKSEHFVVGHLYRDQFGKVYCEGEGDVVFYVTHYLPMSELINVPRET